MYSRSFKNNFTKFFSKPLFANFLTSILFFLIGKLLKNTASISSFNDVLICKSEIIDSISSFIILAASISIFFPLQLSVN